MKGNILLTLCYFFLAGACLAQNTHSSVESGAKFENRLYWFTKAKYGMFIHFGLYSRLGGVWKGQPIDGYSEWIQANADIPPKEYALLTQAFNPIHFNADSIVIVAKNAGMKYLVITAKHHDGFCLWDSKYTDFDVANTPFRRDILRELSDACHRQNIRFGIYYSIIDWHHPSQERNFGGTNGWERWGQIKMKAGKREEYILYMKNQIKELIDAYNTDIFWFDGDWVNWWDNETGISLYNYIRRLKPSIIVNNRVAKRDDFKKDFGTVEQAHLDKPAEYKWEACYTMNNSWGFKKADTAWKQPNYIFKLLREINSKGGNLMLNVGPDGSGKIPVKSVEILLKVGKMLKE